MSASFKKTILPLLLFLGFLWLYVHNLSRAVYSGDSGDLLTTAALGGVAHPPGYPLFTLLGFLLTHQTFIHASPAFLVGLISAFSGALGILIFYFLTMQLTKSRLVSLFATTVLGFSFLYWFYSEIVEVFSLNACFALALFFLALLFRQSKKLSVLFLFSFVAGLSLTNQQTIILVFPSLLLLIIPTAFSQVRKNPFLLLSSLFFLLLGLTPFLYIWIAASHNPIINWDTVHDIPSFLHLVLRKDYGTFQAGIFETITFQQRLITLQILFQYLFFQLTIPVICLCILGFWKLWTKDKLLMGAILLAFFISGPIFLVYAGFPLTSPFIFGTYERFVLLPLCLFLIPLGMGLETFVVILTRFLPKRNYAILFQTVFFLIPLMLCVYNFPKTNLSHFSLGDTYAKDYIESLPKNAVLIVSGDTQTFNIWYVHYVLHIRPDVLVYNLGAAPYHDSVIYPQLADIPQSKQSDYLLGILQRLEYTRPVFSLIKMQPKSGRKILWMPVGLSYEMIRQEEQPSREIYKSQTLRIWHQLHTPTPWDLQQEVFHNVSITEIPTFYADGLVSAGAFAYSTYQDTDFALQMYAKAEHVDPSDPRIYADEAVVAMSKPGNCTQSTTNLSKAISLDPYVQVPYFLLYNISLSCFKDKTVANSVAMQYARIFQKDFQKDYKKSGINAPLYE